MSPGAKDRLTAASDDLRSVRSLVALLEELAHGLVTAVGESDAAPIIRQAVRVLGETGTDEGRAWVLARATVLAADDVDSDRLTAHEALVRNVCATASLDPELPRLVADTEGALDALVAAVAALKERANAQQEWGPPLHGALEALGLVKAGSKPDAALAALRRHRAKVLDRPDIEDRRLIALLGERDY